MLPAKSVENCFYILKKIIDTNGVIKQCLFCCTFQFYLICFILSYCWLICRKLSKGCLFCIYTYRKCNSYIWQNGVHLIESSCQVATYWFLNVSFSGIQVPVNKCFWPLIRIWRESHPLVTLDSFPLYIFPCNSHGISIILNKRNSLWTRSSYLC